MEEEKGGREGKEEGGREREESTDVGESGKADVTKC